MLYFITAIGNWWFGLQSPKWRNYILKCYLLWKIVSRTNCVRMKPFWICSRKAKHPPHKQCLFITIARHLTTAVSAKIVMCVDRRKLSRVHPTAAASRNVCPWPSLTRVQYSLEISKLHPTAQLLSWSVCYRSNEWERTTREKYIPTDV